MAEQEAYPLKGLTDLQRLLKQRTWDKDVLLWLGSERSLLDALGAVNYVVLDLLDLFVPDSLPVDDDDTRHYLTESLRKKLKSIAKGPANRMVLVVKSIGLLTRYNVGLKDFYDWFVGSYTVVAFCSKIRRTKPTGLRRFGLKAIVCTTTLRKRAWSRRPIWPTDKSYARTGQNHHREAGAGDYAVSQRHHPEGKGRPNRYRVPLHPGASQLISSGSSIAWSTARARGFGCRLNMELARLTSSALWSTCWFGAT